MEEIIDKLENILSKKLRVDQQEEVSILLKALIDQIPAMPLQANLQPITTYTEQQASLQCRARIAAILLGQFASACHVRGYVTLAARTFAPHQIEPVATPEIARRVVWSHDRQHISALDLISYVFMLSLCAASGGGIIIQKTQENDEDDFMGDKSNKNQQFYDYQVGSVLDPINVFTESQNNIFNNINSTILALMTEIGARKSQGIYKTFNKMLLTAQATVQVNSLELNSTEELNYHQCCQNVVEVTFQCFGEAYSLLLQADNQQIIQIRQVWLQKQQIEQRERLDVVLYCTLCACLCLQRVQTYIDQIIRMADKQIKQQQKIQQQNKQQAQLIKDLRSQEQQQNNKSKFVNFAKTDMGMAGRAGKNFKKFSELTSDQQDIIKFKATDNLYDYILLKKKLHLLLNDQLFGNNQPDVSGVDQNANPDDEEIIYQQQLKQQQLDRLLMKLSENKQNLESIRQLSNSFCMQQKTTDFASLKTGIVNRDATYRPVNPNVPIVKSNDSKIPQMMALPLKDYCSQISKVFFDETMAGSTWSDLRKAVVSLIYARAVYGGQVFNIECFDDIVQYQETDLGEENLNVDLENAEDSDITKDDPKKVQKLSKTDTHHQVDSQAQTRFQEQKRKQLQQEVDNLKQKMEDIRYTNSRMRLILDNSVIGKTQAMLCRFISYAGKLCSIDDRTTSMTAQSQSDKTQDMKMAIDFRNFCTLVADKVASGGGQIGFVPKVDGATGIRALIADKTLLKTFTSDEIASVLISQWALPVALDSYAVIGLLRQRALGCNPILRTVLNEMLTDLYVYLDVGGKDLMEARKVFNVEIT